MKQNQLHKAHTHEETVLAALNNAIERGLLRGEEAHRARNIAAARTAALADELSRRIETEEGGGNG